DEGKDFADLPVDDDCSLGAWHSAMLGADQAAEKEIAPIGMSSSTGTPSIGAAPAGTLGAAAASSPTPPVVPKQAVGSVVATGSVGCSVVSVESVDCVVSVVAKL